MAEMYVIQNGALFELRQTRFKAQYQAGNEHPHDVCAIARSVVEMHRMIDDRWPDADYSAVEAQGKPLTELYALWAALGDVPVSEGNADVEPESIEVPFLHFPVGTHREEIWRWFESQNPAFLVGEALQGIRR